MICAAKWMWHNRPNTLLATVGLLLMAIAAAYGDYYCNGAYLYFDRGYLPDELLLPPFSFVISDEGVTVLRWMATGIGGLIVAAAMRRSSADLE